MENKNHQALQNLPQGSMRLRQVSKLLSELTESGIVAADLVGESVGTNDVKECLLAMEQNFGKQYSTEISGRVQLLFQMCLEENWSAKRFRDAVKWILKNRPYPTWTIADFFAAPMQKLYPHSEYRRLVHERGKGFNLEIQWYRVNGMGLWAYKHEGDLPFEKIARYEAEPEPEGKIASADELRKAFEKVKFTGHIGREIKEALPLEEKFPTKDV